MKSAALVAMPLPADLSLSRNMSNPTIGVNPRSRTVSAGPTSLAPLILLRQGQYSGSTESVDKRSIDSLDVNNPAKYGKSSTTSLELVKRPGALVRKYSNQFESLTREATSKRDSIPHQRISSGGNVEEKLRTFSAIKASSFIASTSSTLIKTNVSSSSNAPVLPEVVRKLSEDETSCTSPAAPTSTSAASEVIEPRNSTITKLINGSLNGLSPINSEQGSEIEFEPVSPNSQESGSPDTRPLSVSCSDGRDSSSVRPRDRPVSTASSIGRDSASESLGRNSRVRPISTHSAASAELRPSERRTSIVAMLRNTMMKSPKDDSGSSDSVGSNGSNITGFSMNGFMSPLFDNLKKNKQRASGLIVKDGSDPQALSRHASLMKKTTSTNEEQIIGGHIRTLDMMQDMYVKACEEGRVLTLAIARKVLDPDATHDSISIKFTFFHNTCKSIADVSCCIVSVEGLKTRLASISQTHRAFQIDESGQLEGYKSDIKGTIMEAERLLAQYEQAQDSLCVIPTETYRIEGLGEGVESLDNAQNWYLDSRLEHLADEPEYFRRYFVDGNFHII
jgi:hypothetical protein